jgi:hypothetical protein
MRNADSTRLRFGPTAVDPARTRRSTAEETPRHDRRQRSTTHLDRRLQVAERQIRAIARTTRTPDVHLRANLRDVLHRNVVHRLRGPAFVALGVAVGLGANIAAV